MRAHTAARRQDRDTRSFVDADHTLPVVVRPACAAPDPVSPGPDLPAPRLSAPSVRCPVQATCAGPRPPGSTGAADRAGTRSGAVANATVATPVAASPALVGAVVRARACRPGRGLPEYPDQAKLQFQPPPLRSQPGQGVSRRLALLPRLAPLNDQFSRDAVDLFLARRVVRLARDRIAGHGHQQLVARDAVAGQAVLEQFAVDGLTAGPRVALGPMRPRQRRSNDGVPGLTWL